MKLVAAKAILKHIGGELYENYKPKNSDELTTGIIVNSFEKFFEDALEALLDIAVTNCTDGTWDSMPTDVFLKIAQIKNALRNIRADNIGTKVIVY